MDKIVKNLVSVIVPTNNRPALLQQALSSIAGQNYPLIEIIIIANGFDNKTAEVVEQFRQQGGQNIIYLSFDEALGGAKARNIGLDKAGGEYIAFLDDDDTWHKDKLALQVALLQQKNAAIVGANGFYVSADNQHRKMSAVKTTYLKFKDLHYENKLMGFSFCLTKKSYLGKSRINENLDALQDWDLWLKILKNTGMSAFICPAPLVYFRLSGNRISTDGQKVSQAQKRFLGDWRDDLDKRSIFYHQMRSTCLEIKARSSGRIYNYIKHLPLIIKAVFFSPERYNLKKYLHYLLLPIVDMEYFRANIGVKK